MLLALLLAGPAVAQKPTPEAVEAARRAAQAEAEAAGTAAEAARAAAAEELRLAERRVVAARHVQAAELELAEAEARTAAAEAAAEAARARLGERAAALAPMLPLMLRLGLWPAESLLAVPGPPEDTLRGLLVLQGMSRELAAEAAALRAAGAEAARRGAAAATEAAALRVADANARTAVAALEAELEEARQRRAGAEDAETAASRRAAAAAARATSLEGALARLRQEEARAEAARAEAARERAAAAVAASRAQSAARLRRAAEAEMATASTARPAVPPRVAGGRAMPVAGRVVREFGASGTGGAARGLTFQAASGARVVSPCGGRAVFAAPFRSFGQLLIVDCGGGYHFVLAGLDRLDASPGQRLLAGEPVGLLGAGESGGQATLYLELRRSGRPVDPRGWLAGRG
jgi:septal ring factor EnvC (AmiA/AmiB activator)